jgi:hypothetical protein
MIMKCELSRFVRHVTCGAVSIAVIAMVALFEPSATAAKGAKSGGGHHGGYHGGYYYGGSYVRNQQQALRKQQEAEMKYLQALQKQQEAEYKAFMDRFDTNHDGKISGKERGPASKYLRELEMGLDPDAKIKKQQQATMKLGRKSKS